MKLIFNFLDRQFSIKLVQISVVQVSYAKSNKVWNKYAAR